ncbi:hypothetical protein, conserved in T. vivax, (fragment), partial [Trypanosoma vivax Y486]
ATPSETGRKSVSVVKRVSGQSSLSNRNEARNDHVGVGNELHDQPATSHKAQASADDKHGMKLPRARRPAASLHSEGGLTSKNPKECAEVLDRKKEFKNMVSGIIAEVAQDPYKDIYPGYPEVQGHGNYDGVNGYDYSRAVSGFEPEGQTGRSPSEQSNTSTSWSVTSSTPSATPISSDELGAVKENGKESNINNGKVTKNVQVGEKEEKKKKGNEEEKKDKDKEDGNEKGEKQLGKQKSDENSNGRETNSSSDDAENSEAPSSGNSVFLRGSYSSVLLVAVVCLCACAC